ncbi:MAG: DNA translocase FtsK [Sphingomonadales bacterium]|nr:DNA translocase FtsK [Sphingomonadales bacterium]
MASRASARQNSEWRVIFRESLARSGTLLGGLVLGAVTVFLGVALVTHRSSDRSFSTAAGDGTGNWAGSWGAYAADALYTLVGAAAVLLVPLLAVMAVRLWNGTPQPYWKRQLSVALIGIVGAGTALALAQGSGSGWALPAGRGGVAGYAIASGIALLADMTGGIAKWIVAGAIIVLLPAGIVTWYRSLRLTRSPFALPAFPRAREDSGRVVLPGTQEHDEPVKERAILPRKEAKPDRRPPPAIADPAASPAAGARKPAPLQSDMFSNYALPQPDLLTPAPEKSGQAIDKAALERNARLLESVLEDFSVKGEIVAVRPGPVVTMYELEPAPGTKASRVANLAEDIARNMSALSARIAPIPGRTVIGIELPNAHRDPVVLHEMIVSDAFAANDGALPLILGKDIGGDPVIADLAPMPHLLVAGTTGSGKSVGLNAMLVSLLYRLTPDECRMILIDPKMLELSAYENIPHLLAPVVTEPQKAVRALKWAVEQMEDRYRMMSGISVRNLASFNEKVRGALAKGKPLGRRVQTGYDADTGQPVYEEEQLDFRPLPQIVVIVDELADLMMTAGKEVEFLIQRLAQKARAAGIHLIMATQRPSVDVITGVIKANLPTRISFHVTSKIDSRTILGEAGAEQLLGKGDMLYMPGGKGLKRVHGPFVSDDEVRRVADHWREQGRPEFVMEVTEEPEDGGFALEGAPAGDDTPEGRLYRKACQVVFDSQKASTSWLQRQLRIGYNNAARLIERMEEEGLVSAPNHVGRRDVLVDQNGQPL